VSKHEYKPTPKYDPAGANIYPPEACQRVVDQFEGIIQSLWVGFLKISEAKHRKQIFDGLDQFLAPVFGECLLFTAEENSDASPKRGRREYRLLGCHCNNRERLPKASGLFELDGEFESSFLDQALDREKPVFFSFQNMAAGRGPLCKLDNLAVTPIWFDHGGVLLLGVSLLSNSRDQDVWSGWNGKILRFFPELLATPLRIGNHRTQLAAFEQTCHTGLATEVTRLGQSILSSRVHLAWRAAATLAPIALGQTQPAEPPELSGDYDGFFANYLDAQRYVAASAADDLRERKTADMAMHFGGPFLAKEADPAENFGKMFLPEVKNGESRLLFFSTGEANSKDDSFCVGKEATRSRNAIGRSLIWMAYKAGCLNRIDLPTWKCPFPREHDGNSPRQPPITGAHTEHDACRRLITEDYGKPDPLPDEVTSPDSLYTSWLRYLWVEVFYWARCLREDRNENSENLLSSNLAGKYSHALDMTKAFFKKILEIGEKENEELRVDWKWLYLWFLDNVMNSQALQDEYGSYDREKHGFTSHLDHYRDTSTAVLFGLLLVRFWDGAIAMELWDLPELRPDEVMQARVRLLCEYAYREIGVDRAWQLDHRLGAQFEPEMILQVTSSVHREHALHVMDVCLLGHLLLKSGRGASRASLRFRKSLLGKRTEKEFLRAWYPAALLHDLGRAHEIPLSLPELLRHLNTPDLEKYAKSVQEGIEAANVALDEAIISQFESVGLTIADPKARVSHDHGVVSGSHLIHTLKRTAGDETFLKSADTRAILQAIVRHNRSCEVIGASEEPLSYMLVLCDHLQEWSRPRFQAHQLAMGFLGSTQIASRFSVRGQKAARWLTPKAAYVGDQNAIDFRGEDLQFTLQCEAPRSSLFEPACLWVSMTREFERIWFKRGYPTVELEFRHPYSETHARSLRSAYEMELLREFSRTQEGSFLSAWLGTVDRRDGGMSHSVDTPRAGAEHAERFSLTLGLRRKDTPRLLNAMPKNFYTQFVEWKKRQLRLADEE